MEILKNKKSYKINKFNFKQVTIQKNNIIPSEKFTNIEKYSIMEHTAVNNIQFISNLLNKDHNNYLFISKSFDNESLITPIISRNVFKLYNNHFFNFIKKNKIKIIKGRDINYNMVGVNGLIVSTNTDYSKKIKVNDIVKTSTFFGENIIRKNKQQKMKIKISRKKFINLLQKKCHNSTKDLF